MRKVVENHSETIGKQSFGQGPVQVWFMLGGSTQLGLGWTPASAAAGHGDAKDALEARGAGGDTPSLPVKPPGAERDNGHTLTIHWPLIRISLGILANLWGNH